MIHQKGRATYAGESAFSVLLARRLTGLVKNLKAK